MCITNMDKKDFKKIIFDSLNGPTYFGRTDLMYRKEFGIELSSNEYDSFCTFKAENNSYDEERKISLPLYSFNSTSIYFYFPAELSNLIIDYLSKNDANNDLILDPVSLICSELDGTLQIEGVNSTRRQILDVIEMKVTDNKNNLIIQNMYNGILFIKNKPEFNEANLKKLYDILSKGCLDEEDIIGGGNYRFDDVEVDNYHGCPFEKIEVAMNSLFSFVNKCVNDKKFQNHKFLLPHICHYYMLYIHPYFDYNGRTARMVYLWIVYLLGYQDIDLFYLSEAINDKKSSYYNAIKESRESKNDLTYFLIYCISLSNSYQMIYNNCKFIKDKVEATLGEELTNNDIYNIKRILINQQKNYFFSKTYEKWARREVSRQSTHKELAKLEKCEILLSEQKGNKKVYKINDDLVPFIVPKVKDY